MPEIYPAFSVLGISVSKNPSSLVEPQLHHAKGGYQCIKQKETNNTRGIRHLPHVGQDWGEDGLVQ
jgi:hypothetical protein